MVKIAIYSVELNSVKVALIDPNGETYYTYRNKPSLINKEILQVKNGSFEIVLNENKTGKSFFYVKNSECLKPGNFIKVTNLDEIYDFIIISVEKTTESNIVKIVCEELVNIFNRKIPYDYKIFIDSYKDYLSRNERDPLLPVQAFIDHYSKEIKTIENYIAFMILMNFVSDNLYPTMKKEYLFTWLNGRVPRQQYWDLAETTATENKVKIYKENGLINLKTYIVNAWKQYNIDLNMKISGFTPMFFDDNKAFEDLSLEGTITYFPKRKEKKKPQNIDSNTTEIIKAEITNKDKLTSTVILYQEDGDANPYTMLLLKKKNSDEYITVDSKEEYKSKTIGENAEYELADGEVVVDAIAENLEGKTSEEKQKALRKQAADIMRGNRYNHLIEFCIPKNSQLVDVKNLNVLDPVNIKIDGKIYESYISEKIIKDQNLVYYKSGQLKATLTEKLTEEKEESIEKVNKIVNVKIQNLNNKIEKIKDTNIFPVGAIYMSVINENPSKYFGGTWERIAKGRTLVGVDENDRDFSASKKTGGAKTHKLTLEEMPYHKHKFDRQQWYGADPIARVEKDSIFSWKTSEGGSTSAAYGGTTLNAGGDKAHNNLQPYFTVYIWQRTF